MTKRDRLRYCFPETAPAGIERVVPSVAAQLHGRVSVSDGGLGSPGVATEAGGDEQPGQLRHVSCGRRLEDLFGPADRLEARQDPGQRSGGPS